MNICPICNEPTTITDDTFFKWQECKRKCISKCVGLSEQLERRKQLNFSEQLIHTIKKCQTINYTIIQLND